MKILNLILTLATIYYNTNCNAQIQGCTDPLASNFNSAANVNDGSCIYDMVTVSPVSSFTLPAAVSETSGLIHWNGQVWTNNDSDDSNLYSLDTLNGSIIRSLSLDGLVNNDWEEISEDRDFIYVGDFGNNSAGNRKDLKIWRISKSSLLSELPVAEAINFSYSDQMNFDPAGSNSTNFDCEAMIVSADSIYLFTKQWISYKTALYALAKTPGTHIARLKEVYDADGLITGAVYLWSKKVIALTGYGNEPEPFILLLYDFKGSDFFGGNKRKISISLPYHQVEAVTTADGLKYYITNEYFNYPPLVTVLQKMHILDLNPFLRDYLGRVTGIPAAENRNGCSVYPVPAKDHLTVISDEGLLPATFRLTNQLGQVVLRGSITEERQLINLSPLPCGLYIITVAGSTLKSFKIVKK